MDEGVVDPATSVAPPTPPPAPPAALHAAPATTTSKPKAARWLGLAKQPRPVAATPASPGALESAAEPAPTAAPFFFHLQFVGPCSSTRATPSLPALIASVAAASSLASRPTSPRPHPRPRPPSAARPPCPASLRGQCAAGEVTTLVDLDPSSGRTFDLGYYRGVAARRGLLSTDGALLLNGDTSAYVMRQGNATATAEFFADFAASLVNMSKIGALTHHKGEIRRHCSAVNPPSASSLAPVTMSAHAAVLLASSLVSIVALALVL
ncbi:hypothetical protein ZWY2020_038605 [Hordeum vulgare]|nr:hypothetical protein ZWY2020_038605 [Hordeum vulgare]